MSPFIDRRAAALGLIASLAGGVAQAEEKQFPATKVFPFLGAYLSLAPGARDRFHLTYTLYAKSGRVAGTQVWLVMDGRRTPLAITPDGQVSPPSRADLERAQIVVSIPAGAKIGIRMEVAASLAPRTDYAASALQASLDQANAGMRAGVPLLGPPKLRRVTFQGAQGGEAAPRSGRSTALPTGPDGPYYEPDDAAGTTIRLRRVPTVILLEARG